MADTKHSNDVQKYLDIIDDYDKDFAKWEKRAGKIVKRYRDERTATSATGTKKYPSLWSNLQTLIPACYSKTPSPEVCRRFSDDDDVGRVASTILQRALEFEMKHYGDFAETMIACIQDRFLSGRGTAWVRYDPEFEDAEVMVDDEDAGDDLDEEAEEETPQTIVDERTPIDYVHWQDFGHNVARTWGEVTMVWRMVYMGRKSLVKRFGEEIGNDIPLDSSSPDTLNTNAKKLQGDKKALVYEIWDKENEKVVWLNKSTTDLLDEVDDPLHLEEFFPCPKPIYSTITSDTLVPIPDFVFYQDQAESLDLLQNRIDGLLQALKVSGVYDAAFPELKRLMTEGNNTSLIPVTNYGGLSEKGGLKGAIDLIPLDVISATLEQLFNAQKALKDEINYITGLADIVHGIGDAGETATAQGIKGNYVGLRLNCSQGQVAQFATDIIRIKAQIICSYQPQILLEISAADQLSEADQQLIPQALQLITNTPLRTFRIEVDADSMVNIDESQEREDRINFVTAFSQALQAATPALEKTPQAAPIIIELLKFGAGAYKGAKSIEGQLDSQLDQIAKMEQQAIGQPKPDPEMAKLQAKSQADMQQKQMELQFQAQADKEKLGLQLQIEQQKAQLTMQVEQQEQQAQAAQIAQQNHIEAQRDTLKMQQDAAFEQQKQEHDMQLAQQQMEFEKWKAELDNNTKIVLAEIAAKSSIDSATASVTPPEGGGMADLVGAMNTNLEKLMDLHVKSNKEIITTLSKPKQVIRGSDGKVIGVQ